MEEEKPEIIDHNSDAESPEEEIETYEEAIENAKSDKPGYEKSTPAEELTEQTA